MTNTVAKRTEIVKARITPREMLNVLRIANARRITVSDLVREALTPAIEQRSAKLEQP